MSQEGPTTQTTQRSGVRHRWIAVLGIVLTATVIAVYAIVFAQESTSQQSSHETQIKQAIKEANYCEQDSDCVIAEQSACPFGCHIAVNKAEAARIKGMIEEYNNAAYGSQCIYSCVAIENVSCAQNQCVTTPES